MKIKNKQAIGEQLARQLAALLSKKNPTASDASEVRKIMTMLHALDDAAATGNDRTAAALLKAMPYASISDNDELVLNQTAMQGLGKMDQEAASQIAEGTGKAFKALISRIKERRKNRGKTPFLDRAKDFVQQQGGKFGDKVKEFFDKVKPKVDVDLTSALDWKKILAIAAGVTAVGVVGYKMAKK